MSEDDDVRAMRLLSREFDGHIFRDFLTFVAIVGGFVGLVVAIIVFGSLWLWS